MGFYEKYIETVTKNDSRTRNSVDAIIGRIDELLDDRPDGRLSGLVVGRVQSGKTRNYVGLALKAAEAGWNVIIILTSPIMALAEQTEKRIKRDFKKSKVFAHNAAELNFLSDAGNPDAEGLGDSDARFFFWGVAMKQTTSLRRIAKWMESNKQYAPYMRVLVIDDEADYATPDSNAGKQKTEEQNEDLIQNVVEAMEDCGEKFAALANWLYNLWMMDVPDLDDGAKTQEAEDCLALKTLLGSSTKTPKAIVGTILDSAVYAKLLGLDAHVVEDDELSDELADVAREFFGQTRAPRSPKTFVDVLKAVFSVAMGRSRINKAIISLVDKQAPEAADYTYPFERCAYIAYTATPYACILNERPDQTTIYPDFIYSLEKSPKYFGLDEIYGQKIFRAGSRMDIIRSIPDDEEGGILAPLAESTYFINSEGKKRYAAPSVRVEEDLTCCLDDGGIPKPKDEGECEDIDEDDVEGDECDEEEVEEVVEIPWQTLKDSIAWTFCCAAARRWHRINVYVPSIMAKEMDDKEREEKLNAISERWTTMLFNISPKTKVHKKTAEHLDKYLECRLGENASHEDRAEFVAECEELWRRETARFDASMFNTLFNASNDTSDNYGKFDAAPAWEDIEPHFDYFFKAKNRNVVIINSMGKESRANQVFYATGVDKMRTIKEDHLWFICGGNTIARGLTLEGLVASYFDRVKQSVAVDTMTQMGRWFGYRIGYELLPRVWMTPYSVGEFKKTAIVEERMHESIRENFKNKASPCDRASYQMVYYYGRKLSGRSRAMMKLDTGVGTYGSTNDLSISLKDVDTIHKRLARFMRLLQDKYALSAKEQQEREQTCMYGKVPLWRNVPKTDVADFLMDVAVSSPENSRKMLKGLVREMNSSTNAVWDVVVAEPVNAAGRRTYDIGGARSYALGHPSATTVANGVARYSAARLHLPYYADIPTKAINAIDFKVLRENLAYIVSSIQKEQAKGAKLEQLEEALSPFGKGDIRERLERFLNSMDKEPYEAGIPDGIHGQIRGKLEGFRNRASSEYMEAVHARAGNRKPILQIYLLEPPEANLGDKPLVTFAFYWPAHEPTNFCAVTTGLEPRPPAPLPRKFYDAVEAVLKEWDFPMATRRLRNTVIDRLGPGCTKDFFDKHIAKIPEGRQYEPVPGRDAYKPKGWGDKEAKEIGESIDGQLLFIMLFAALAFIRKDCKQHKSADVFSKVLEDPKFGDFFSVGSTNDFAKFNKAMMALFTAENGDEKTVLGVKVVKRRPITWQYQG